MTAIGHQVSVSCYIDQGLNFFLFFQDGWQWVRKKKKKNLGRLAFLLLRGTTLSCVRKWGPPRVINQAFDALNCNCNEFCFRLIFWWCRPSKANVSARNSSSQQWEENNVSGLGLAPHVTHPCMKWTKSDIFPSWESDPPCDCHLAHLTLHVPVGSMWW